MARLTVRTPFVAFVLFAGVVLSSCGTSGAVADARASCVDVHRALVLQKASDAPGVSTVRQAQLQARALSALLRATPSAAAATSIDGSWNALMTTINEAERVPMADLVPALTRLCNVADSATPYL